MSDDWRVDAQLLERWRAGDKDAGDQLLARHADVVIRFFRNKLPDDVEDCVQETFVRVLEARDRIRDGVAMRGYIIQIARHVSYEKFRSKAGASLDLEAVSAAAVAPSPGEIFTQRQEHRLLVKALRRIPIKHQEVLELHYWEGLKTDDIAEIIGRSPSATRSRLDKARDLLEAEIRAVGASAKLISSTVGGLETWAREVRERLAIVSET